MGVESNFEYRVLEYIAKNANREHPAKRDELEYVLNATDRTLREAISSLRMKGIRICSSSKCSGYWLAEGDDDYEAFRRDYLSRVSVIARTVRAMDRNIPGQVSYEEELIKLCQTEECLRSQ